MSKEWYSEDPNGINASFAPGKVEHEGYLYVLELDTGVIKVGKATAPRGRLQSHISNAEAMGRVVVRGWVSTPHTNFSKNEQALIKSCAGAASRIIRKEYFEGVGLAQARRFVRGLPLDRWTAEDEARYQARRHAEGPHRYPGYLDDDERIVTQSYIDAAERWLRLDHDAPLPNGQARTLADPSEGGLPAVPIGSDLYQQLERIAELKGLTVEDVADWSYIDVIGDLLATQAETIRQRWMIFAYESGRTDLLDPWVELEWPGEAS